MAVWVAGREVYCDVYVRWFPVDAEFYIVGVPVDGQVKVVCDTVFFCGHFELQVFVNIIAMDCFQSCSPNSRLNNYIEIYNEQFNTFCIT